LPHERPFLTGKPVLSSAPAKVAASNRTLFQKLVIGEAEYSRDTGEIPWLEGETTQRHHPSSPFITPKSSYLSSVLITWDLKYFNSSEWKRAESYAPKKVISTLLPIIALLATSYSLELLFEQLSRSYMA